MLQRKLKKDKQTRKSRGPEEWRAKRKKSTTVVFVGQIHKCISCHCCLFPWTSCRFLYALFEEVFVRKVKITEEAVFQARSLARDLSSGPLKSVTLQQIMKPTQVRRHQVFLNKEKKKRNLWREGVSQRSTTECTLEVFSSKVTKPRDSKPENYLPRGLVSRF